MRAIIVTKFSNCLYQATMNKTEKFIRQFLRVTCDKPAGLEPDLKIICNNGVSFAHKFALISVLPDLQKLFCESCLSSHDEVTIFIPNISKETFNEARDFLYMYGDVENLAKLFGMKKDTVNRDKTIDLKKRRRENNSEEVTKKSKYEVIKPLEIVDAGKNVSAEELDKLFPQANISKVTNNTKLTKRRTYKSRRYNQRDPQPPDHQPVNNECNSSNESLQHEDTDSNKLILSDFDEFEYVEVVESENENTSKELENFKDFELTTPGPPLDAVTDEYPFEVKKMNLETDVQSKVISQDVSIPVSENKIQTLKKAEKNRPKLKPLKCENCNFTTKFKTVLQEHQRRESNSRTLVIPC